MSKCLYGEKKSLSKRQQNALAALPFKHSFIEAFQPESKGVFYNPERRLNAGLNTTGSIVKVGELMGKRPRKGGNWVGEKVHHDYSLVFSSKKYGSMKEAIKAASLHARFYRKLVEKDFFPKDMLVSLHSSSKKEVAITVVSPWLYQHTPEFGAEEDPAGVRLREKMFNELPGFENLVHPDVLHGQNYGCAITNKGENVYEREKWFYSDLHVFKSPHAKKTREWLEKLLSEEKKN